MPARVTIERLLRDKDDESGQTVRDWKIEAEADGAITIRLKHGEGFLLLRHADIDLFTSDIECARDGARSLLKDEP